MKQKSKASVLAVSLIILGMILLIAISVSTVSVQERKASMSSSSSSQAYQVAETGIEKVMYEVVKGGHSTVNQISPGSCNAATGLIETNGYKVELRDSAETKIACNTSAAISLVENIKSTGTAGQNSRAIEAAVAAASTCGSIPVEIDSSDKGPATFVAAATACRSLGNCWHLPSFEELSIFSGISSATGNMLWTSGQGLRDDGSIRATINISGGNWADAGYTGSQSYRCVR